MIGGRNLSNGLRMGGYDVDGLGRSQFSQTGARRDRHVQPRGERHLELARELGLAVRVVPQLHRLMGLP